MRDSQGQAGRWQWLKPGCLHALPSVERSRCEYEPGTGTCSLLDAVSQQVLDVGRAPCETSAGALILCSPRNGGGTGRDPVGENGVEGCCLCWIKASEDRVRLPGLGWTCAPGGRPTSSFLPTRPLSCLEFPAAERGGRIPGKLALGLMRNR